MSEGFSILKVAHILSAAVILGTGFGIAFFTWFGYRSALRTGEISVLRHTLRYTVIVSGVCLTALQGGPSNPYPP